jgi:site-specific DNA recombinase
MKKVILYCRVSTEEQAQGNSLDYQEMRLKEYCHIMRYDIFDTIKDNESGKDFNRKGWKEIRKHCKVKNNKIDGVLFLRWDRFARNLGLSLNEIEYLKKFGVEVNSSEQPLDFNSPNSILLLSTYLAIPEVERNNISRRTKECTYKAQIEGKCTNKAPIGYTNDNSNEKNKKVLINDKTASLVKWAFIEASKGIKSIELIRRELNPKGLKISKSSFPRMLKNQFYIGLVFVNEWMENPSHWVKGRHQALIDDETFDKVQEMHFGKKKVKPKVCKTSTDEFFLRDFLKCPHCGKKLTACYSRGNGGEYPYYKCHYCHKFNANATKANELFVDYIRTLKPNDAVLKLYVKVFAEIKYDRDKNLNKEVANVILMKEKEVEKLKKIDDEYADGKLKSDNYGRIVDNIQAQIQAFDDEIYRLTTLNEKKVDVKFDYAVNLLSNMDLILTTAPLADKINVLGSMFPDKIEFDGKKHRTDSYNKVLDVIFKDTNQLRTQKKEESVVNSESSSLVPGAGIEPALHC